MTVVGKSWQVDNFKGVKSATLPLSGLSILSGRNSAGKTSLTQSLLLLAQSARGGIVLNGPLVRFGAASDVINESSDTIRFRWATARTNYLADSDKVGEELVIEISLKGPRSKDALLGTALVVSELKVWRGQELVFHASDVRVRAATLNANNPGRKWGDSLLRVHRIENTSVPARTFIAFEGLFPSFMVYKKEKTRFAKKLRAAFDEYIDVEKQAAVWIARELVFSIDELIRAGERKTVAGVGNWNEDIYTLLGAISQADGASVEGKQIGSLDEIFARLASRVADNDIIGIPMNSRGFYPLGYRGPEHISGLIIPDGHISAWQDVAVGFFELKNLAERIRYIGPLREEPQVLSSTGGRSGTTPAGIRGEYTADLLYRNREDAVRYVDPAGEERYDLLLEAVGVWAAYLGVGEAIEVVDGGKLGRGIRVKVQGRERDLTTIGVGVSQLLPVIAVVLAADSNSLVILEQPELHLHPAIQSRLAEFFSLARPDLGIIVETHSEYLITRLRRLRVSESLGMPDLSFLFAHPGVNGSVIEPLPTDSLGDIDRWPEGFFDTQEEEERLLLGALMARSKAKK